MSHLEDTVQHSTHHVAGAVIAAISMAVPDELASFALKILIGALTGLISGMAYKLGTILMERIKK